jgi:hypothetical protein
MGWIAESKSQLQKAATCSAGAMKCAASIYISSRYKKIAVSGSPHCRLQIPQLISNPRHVLQKNFLTAPVIEFCGPAVGVAGDSLSGFKGAVIFQKIRDAGRPE